MDANQGLLEEVVEIGVDGEIEPLRVEVSEANVQDDESEWPSLNLDANTKSLSSTFSGEKSASENSVIPGLSVSKSKLSQSNVVSEPNQHSGLADCDMDESPLGELRFKD